MKMKRTILLGLSGGVDSSVAALLLKRKGYRIIGAFLKMYSDSKNPLSGECSYLDDKKDAQKIASLLGIEFIELDFEKIYKKEVLDKMFSEYSRGLTPNPDVLCNSIIKFPLLWKEAKKLGAEHIATGHYAGIKKSRSGYELLAGKDKSKDQSYFLAGLNQEDLSHSIFPLGNLEKNNVRKIAKKNGFPNWNKHGTTGICFVGKINMHDFLKKKIQAKIGKVVNPENIELGLHEGTSFYTIGQKAGSHIGINIQKPVKDSQKKFYVADKKEGNVLVVASEGHPSLKIREISVQKMHFINREEKGNFKARIRHLGELYAGKLDRTGGKWKFVFNKGVEGAASGQVIVIYDGERVVGCGEIRV